MITVFDREIELIHYTRGVDSDGFTTLTEVATTVFAGVLSVTRSEIASSTQSGQTPVIVFSVLRMEYESLKHIVDGRPKYVEAVRYDGCVYSFIKEYTKGNLSEITCG